MKQILLLSFATILLASCSSSRNMAHAGLSVNGETISQSLFVTKDASIKEDDIQKILDGKLTLPPKVRIALVDLNNHQNRYYGGNPDNMLAQQNYMDTIVHSLRENKRTESALIVPKMILNSTGFTEIREAAVRMQTDIVLVYLINTNGSKYKKDKIKGYRAIANIQLMAIDVRTGLVPFSSIVTKDFFIKEEKENNKGERASHAQNKAILQSIDKVCMEINEFLSK